jgi:hypothetical protein
MHPVVDFRLLEFEIPLYGFPPERSFKGQAYTYAMDGHEIEHGFINTNPQNVLAREPAFHT